MASAAPIQRAAARILTQNRISVLRQPLLSSYNVFWRRFSTVVQAADLNEPKLKIDNVSNSNQEFQKSLLLSHGVAFKPKPKDQSYTFRRSQTKFEHPAGPDGPVSGEDAFFVKTNDNSIFISVFDGVGGWAEEGYDPSRASWLLCKKVQQALDSHHNHSLQGMINSALVNCEQIALQQNIRGSTTICAAQHIISFAGGKLSVFRSLKVNYPIGDSGLCVVRNGQIVFETEYQWSSFNMPYQIAVPYEFLRRLGASNNTSDAVVQKFTIQPRDTVIIATDGLWDNLSSASCAQVVETLNHPSARQVADELLLRAVVASESNQDSPFSKNARRQGISYQGGKIDDITIAVLHFS